MTRISSLCTYIAVLFSFYGSFSFAGQYSSYSEVTVGAIDNPIQRNSDVFQFFESSVVTYLPAPGVGPNYSTPTTRLSSLGELYSPVSNPDSSATSFVQGYAPVTGREPNASHAGSVNDPFSGDLQSPTDTYGFIGIDKPGSITLGFSSVISNGIGHDFAVFENGFAFGGPTSLFAEFAFVEVSTDGIEFARFPSISLNTAPTAVAGTFQGFDVTNVYNLAGKHASNWGTPFDLDDLSSDLLVIDGVVDLNSIHFVRLVDVVGSGSILDQFGNEIAGIAKDSLGNPILDNWVTFDSGGFDYLGLNVGAVGVIHSFASVPEPSSLALIAGVLGSGMLWQRRRGKRGEA